MCARVRDLQRAMRGRRQVVDLDDLADTARIHVRDAGKVEQNSTRAAAQERLDAALQLDTDRHAQGAVDTKDRQSA